MRVYRDSYTYHCVSNELENKANVLVKRCYRYVTRMLDHFTVSSHPSRKITSRFFIRHLQIICAIVSLYIVRILTYTIKSCFSSGHWKSIFLPINKRRNSLVCINDNVAGSINHHDTLASTRYEQN